MMTRTEHLLVCLMEECAEVQKECAKALRFGLADTNPKTGVVNRDAISIEGCDIVAVYELLEESGAVPRGHSIADIERKKAAVLNWMEYAKEGKSL